MKTLLPLLVTAGLFIFSCEKNPGAETIKGDVRAHFTVWPLCQNDLLPNKSFRLDSIVVFTNGSMKTGIINAGEVISYSWSFGDNTASTDESPQHQYHKTGTYEVRLIALLNGQPVDTAVQSLTIFIGQREIKTAMTYNTAIDIAETADNGALVLMQSSNDLVNNTYNLIKLDSVLHQEWIKPLGSGIRLSSIRQASATEYILSGNVSAGAANQFCVSKIDKTGNLLWCRFITGLTGLNNYTVATAGGFITSGTVNVAGNYYTAVVKLNAAGDESWRTVLTNNRYTDPENIIETSSGYVLACKPSFLVYRFLITQLSFTGGILKQDSIPVSTSGSPYSAGIARSGSGYMVSATGTNMVYLLDNNFGLLGNAAIGRDQISSVVTGDNLYYVTESGGQYGSVKAVDLNGTEIWHYTIHNNLPIGCNGMLMGATRRCRKVLYTSAHEIIALSDGNNNPAGGFSTSTYVAKISGDGIMR